MAFKETSNDIVIDAVFTETGRKKIAKGTFRVVKFSLGDDEIDYTRNFEAASASFESYRPKLLDQPLLEAYSDHSKNIEFGLMSYTDKDLLYLPILGINTKVEASAQPQNIGTGSFYYLSVNDETTTKINEIQTVSGSTFNILTSDRPEKTKIIIESGLGQLPELSYMSYEERDRYLVSKNLLDKNFFILADNRFVEKIMTCAPDSKFRNFPDGTTEINFQSMQPAPPTSYPNQFDKYVTFLSVGINNLMSDHDFEGLANRYSAIAGLKGTVTAFNLVAEPSLRVGSAGTRDYKYEKYGQIDQKIFDEVNKFDYIESPLYVIGTTSNSRIHVPLRIIRYAGT